MSEREPPDESGVRGERATALVATVRSLQSRLSSVLAAGLMILLGVGALSWYYTHALTQQMRAREAARSGTRARAQTEMALPPLGRIDPPVPALRDPQPAKLPVVAVQTPAPATSFEDLPLAPSAGPPAQPGVAATPVAAGSAEVKSPAELARERRLSGAVFAQQMQSPQSTPEAAARAPAAFAAAGTAAGAGPDTAPVPGGAPADASPAALGAWLHPTVTPAALAQRLPTQRLLLPKGAFIDCTLETAIDSTLPGMTTCITATDTFGADGKVVLLERGTKLVGETRGEVLQGRARVFVLWTQARTPTGVVVPLDSPGTDELGRSGLRGEVKRHFWQRFGAAMLISLVDGAVQAGVQASNHSGGAVVYAPSGATEVATEALKDTLRIAPTVIMRNGARIQVLVARDLDFRPVYELRSAAGR